MKIKLLILFFCFFLGAFLGIFINNSLTAKDFGISLLNPLSPITPKKTVIGFLPYWLLDKAETDYSKYITTLSYFAVTADGDGNIQKFSNPGEKEPGWYALESGKAEPFLREALKNNVSLSLVVANMNNDSINEMISDPVPHAKNLAIDLKPLIQKYKFSDINLDIESVKKASPSARANFTKFVKAVREELDNDETLTVEISAGDLINNNLIDAAAIGKIADYVVVMAYDYHYRSSFVTGPVAPLTGAGISSEYDVSAAMEKILEIVPAQKVILGIPLYGYEWESIGRSPRSAIIPNTGVAASNRRAEKFLESCPDCKDQLDNEAEENYISFFDKNTGNYRTIFYPNENSTLKKIGLANNYQLGGLALWALGYEGKTILNPLANYQGEAVKPILAKTVFSLEKAPVNSITGKIASLSGSVAWQSRVSPKAILINSPQKLQQGEELETRYNGQAAINFPKAATITASADTQLNFVQTLPANFVVQQKTGSAVFEKKGDIPVSIIALNLLINIDSGKSEIYVDPENSQIIISVEEGSATAAFNDTQNTTNILTIDEGSEYVFDNDAKLGEINDL